jgi:hypothetical protein
MTSPDSQVFESYIPIYDTVPEKWEDAREFIVEQLKKLGIATNQREIGLFIDTEILSGQQWIPTAAMSGAGSSNSQQFRTVLRKVINFGALPAGGTKSVPHGIVFDINFTLTNLYLAATDPVNFLAFSLQYWANSAPGSIILNMDATNVNVTVTSNYSAYTRSFIVIEYLLEI